MEVLQIILFLQNNSSVAKILQIRTTLTQRKNYIRVKLYSAVLLQCTPPHEFAWEFQMYLKQWFCRILITIVFSSLERQTPTYSCHNLCIVLYFFEAGTPGTIRLGKEAVRTRQFKMSRFKWINKSYSKKAEHYALINFEII